MKNKIKNKKYQNHQNHKSLYAALDLAPSVKFRQRSFPIIEVSPNEVSPEQR
jgi:hypothetical protein